MRKVVLSMKAQEKYETIRRLAEGRISKETAAVKIGCTLRHFGEMIQLDASSGAHNLTFLGHFQKHLTLSI